MSALPERIGRYRVVSRLGSGGMAEVFLGVLEGPLGFEKSVVLKRIRPELAVDESYRQMFVNEARITSVLSHSHVVSVLDFGEADGSLFLALEHVEGLDLAHVLERTKKLAPSLSAFIGACVLRGLGYAHARRDGRGEPLGIVHRDLSPANILLGRNGDVKIADFGIAKAQGPAPRTAPGTLKGKLGYMSPEQAAGQPVDPRSDLFTVGLVLYEMLLGAPAYAQKSNAALLMAVREARIEVPSSLGAVGGVLQRALAPSPRDRFATADEMATALLQSAPALVGSSEVEKLVEQLMGSLDASKKKTLVPRSPWSRILKSD